MSDTNRESRGRWVKGLDVAATISTVVAACVLVGIASANYLKAGSPREPMPEDPIEMTGNLAGPVNANIGIVIFSDFECPYCRSFATDALPRLFEQYVERGIAAVSFRHFPLPFHKNARKAAAVAECAGEQGQFWQMHDLLFREPQLGVDTIERNALTLRLNINDLGACQDSAQTQRRVDADFAAGRQLGVSGTPTIFIGPRQPNGAIRARSRFVGAKPIQSFQAAIDSLLPAKARQ